MKLFSFPALKSKRHIWAFASVTGFRTRQGRGHESEAGAGLRFQYLKFVKNLSMNEKMLAKNNVFLISKLFLVACPINCII